MNQRLTFGIVVTLIVAGVGYYLYSNRSASPAATPQPASTATPAPTPATVGSQTHPISMDASGFTPANVTVRVGDRVTFRNNDARTRWPASDVHPTHLLCPGFDAARPLAAGETYTHTFTEVGECPMHDHLLPRLKGKITVTE